MGYSPWDCEESDMTERPTHAVACSQLAFYNHAVCQILSLSPLNQPENLGAALTLHKT